MKEIKCRAWDKTRGEWCRVNVGWCGGDLAFHRPEIEYQQNILEIVQYIGLFDEQGKEIYEGDIVQRCCDGVAITRVVEWEECYWVFRTISDGITDIPEQKLITYLRYKIIGNIWEDSH